MDTAAQIKARLTPDVVAFGEKTYGLLFNSRYHKSCDRAMDEVLFWQTVSLAYTHGRCDANNEVFAGLRKAHGVK